MPTATVTEPTLNASYSPSFLSLERNAMNSAARYATFVCVQTIFLGAVGCGAQSGSTVKGPETAGLLSGAAGQIVVSDAQGGIAGVSIPTTEKTTIKAASSPNVPDLPTIHALSGPDSLGRIAFIEDHFFVAPESQRRHSLKWMKVGADTDTKLFTRPGAAMWAGSQPGPGAVGESLSLSPIGGQIAMLTDTSPQQMPGARLSMGEIELWDIQQAKGRRVGVRALDEPVAWFPDGCGSSIRCCRRGPTFQKRPWDLESSTQTPRSHGQNCRLRGS